MALKIRIMASRGSPARGPVTKLVYRAEAYDGADTFAERRWSCEHDHETAEHAFHCGMSWLSDNQGAAAEAEPA